METIIKSPYLQIKFNIKIFKTQCSRLTNVSLLKEVKQLLNKLLSC